MRVINNPEQLKSILRILKNQGKSIGIVPTMGFLHEGHLSLIKRARIENDIVVVSIFVNPTQFGLEEDLKNYPRDLERDCDLINKIGGDFVFAPEVGDMYPKGYKTYLQMEGDLTNRLCGVSRPGHFTGVLTVVNKLFNIIRPDKAYFGQKDAQQICVIEQMVKDTNMDVEIVPCPIVRESDGLAMSSRNFYLNPIERQEALILSRSLRLAIHLIKNGERDADFIKEELKQTISESRLANIDYIEIVDAKNLMDIEKLEGSILIALAVKIGKTRLIDNIRIEL